jgi:hypothetical protein
VKGLNTFEAKSIWSDYDTELKRLDNRAQWKDGEHSFNQHESSNEYILFDNAWLWEGR